MSAPIFALAVAFAPDGLTSYILALGLGYGILQVGMVIVDSVREQAEVGDRLTGTGVGSST